MGESRSELIAWLNELLQLNYTKIEQCGTGAAYCQIIDSVYGAFRIDLYSYRTRMLTCLGVVNYQVMCPWYGSK